jgi:hypothetical protein
MPRTNASINPAIPEEPVVEQPASSDLVPQPVEYPIGFRPLDGIPEFLDNWSPEGIIVSAEALGAFRYYAKQQNWFADTPSGWMEKFSRWESNS